MAGANTEFDNDFAFDAPTGGDIFDDNTEDNADDWFGEPLPVAPGLIPDCVFIEPRALCYCLEEPGALDVARGVAREVEGVEACRCCREPSVSFPF